MDCDQTRLRKALVGVYFSVIAIFFLTIPGICHACPNCKEALQTNGLSNAFAASILFLMGMPFAILLAWFYAIRRLVRGATKR